MERKYIKTFEQFVNESEINEGHKLGIIFVTKDKKQIFDIYDDWKKVPLKKGLDMTRYIMDDNEFAANMDLEKHKDAMWMKVPYVYGKITDYTGKSVKQSVNEDTIPGGKGDMKDSADVDGSELKVGIAVEIEHTDDKEKAEEIAMDHLTEDPHYYSKLIKAGLADEAPALKLAKELLNVEPTNEGIINEGETLIINITPIKSQQKWKNFVDEVKTLMKGKKLCSGPGDGKAPYIVSYDKIEINGCGEKSGEPFILTKDTDKFQVKTYARPYQKTIIKVLRLMKNYTDAEVKKN